MKGARTAKPIEELWERNDGQRGVDTRASTAATTKPCRVPRVGTTCDVPGSWVPVPGVSSSLHPRRLAIRPS
eukprot:7964441-Heterocapsa_arctica.AAC.1